MVSAESEVMHHFDSRRRDFAPYGFTCEVWEPRQMPRPDRHDEIEINFLDRGTLTYLIGGQRVTVQARRVSAFWAAVPHQIVAFDNVNYYYVVTVPFGWVLQWGLPEQLMVALTQGQIVADTNATRAALDRQLFEQWHEDVEGRRNTNREIVVLELRARLLRLAESVVDDRSHARRLPGTTPARDSKPIWKRPSRWRALSPAITRRGFKSKTSPHASASIPTMRRRCSARHSARRSMCLITRHRVAHAQRQLVTTDERVVHIAHDSGFDSLSRFNRAFKQIAGVTPRQYRKTLGQNAICGRIELAA